VIDVEYKKKLAIVLSVLLRFTDFEYRFDIFKLFLYNNNDSFNENTIKCISYVIKSINCDGFRFYLSNKKDDMERNHPLVKSSLFPNNYSKSVNRRRTDNTMAKQK
jgi:hypothetical protein